MLVNGADAEIAAAGHGNRCLAKSAQQCAHQIVGRANLTCQLMGDGAGVYTGAVQLKGGAVHHPNRCAHSGQNIKIQLNIRHIRDIFNPAHAVYQQRSRENCHRSVLCTADLNLTVQGFSTVYHVLCHNAPSQSLISCLRTIVCRKSGRCISSVDINMSSAASITQSMFCVKQTQKKRRISGKKSTFLQGICYFCIHCFVIQKILHQFPAGQGIGLWQLLLTQPIFYTRNA